MKGTFKLTQLYRSPAPAYIRATCMVNDDRFECDVDLPREAKEQLWQYVNGNWEGLTAEIIFSDINTNGVPSDGLIKSVKGFTPIYF